MKKIFLAILVALVSISASAQKGETSAGINLSYGTEHLALGIGVKGQYGITDAIRAEASFDYFLKKDGLSMWDINLNAHYLFSVSNKFKVYPLVGVAFTNWSSDFEGLDYSDYEDYSMKYSRVDSDDDDEGYEDDSSSSSKFGINIGAGLQYCLTDKLSVNLEGKYQIISDFDQPIFSIGLAYKF